MVWSFLILLVLSGMSVIGAEIYAISDDPGIQNLLNRDWNFDQVARRQTEQQHQAEADVDTKALRKRQRQRKKKRARVLA